MKILIAPDSFKNSLSAREVAKNIELGLKKVSSEIETILLPMADGGEGTVNSLLGAIGGKLIQLEVHDPLMRIIKAHYGILSDNVTAIIEMAASSGLELLKKEERNPLKTSTYGLGEMIKDALDKGCNKIIVGLGGSATNDAGSGMIMALGGRLIDKKGELISLGGKGLINLDKIDLFGIDKRIKNCEFIAACDVSNPLYGEYGAANIYAPQKGATPQMVKQLDNNLEHFADVVNLSLKKDIAQMESAGAAGGLGGGLYALLSANIKSGFEIVKELTNLEEKIKNVDLVITGEGKIDLQTTFGKAPYGVAMLSKKYKKPVIAITGMIGDKIESLSEIFDTIVPIMNKPMSLEEALQDADFLIQSTAERLMQLFLINLPK